MPYDQRTFTLKAKEWLKRLKVKTVKRSNKTVFKGIGTPRKELQLVQEVHPEGLCFLYFGVIKGIRPPLLFLVLRGANPAESGIVAEV